MIFGVIPARAGSKGVKNKNVRPLAGRPLLAYIIDAAKKSRLLDEFIVSTEDDEIAKTAKRLGAQVPFLRPKYLAKGEVSIIPVVKHAMEYFDAKGDGPEVVVSLQVTSPFTTSRDIDSAIRKLQDTGCDSVVSMKLIEECHPVRAYKFNGDRVGPFNEYTSEKFLQRQDRPPAHKFSGAIYVRRRELLEDWSGEDFALGKDVRGILIPAERAVDINTPLDFLVAEILMKKGKTKCK